MSDPALLTAAIAVAAAILAGLALGTTRRPQRIRIPVETRDRRPTRR